jgi:hypothetical protein
MRDWGGTHTASAIMNAAIVRFPNVDPLIDTFHFVTGYNYAENEPVGHIDLWGLQKAKPDQRLSPGDQDFLTALGSVMEKTGDAVGKFETAALTYLAATTASAPPTAVVTAPTSIVVVGVVGGAGTGLELGGQIVQHLVREDQGTATNANRAKLAGKAAIDLLLPEPVEQALKKSGINDKAASAVGSAIMQGIEWVWDKLTSDQ